MTVKLRRFDTGEAGTYGEISIDGEYVCFATEPPWKDNKPCVSCIPAGTYQLARRYSPKFGKSWHVLDVPGRTHILFHEGNYQRNTLGCIMPATMLSRDSHLSGLSSRLALERFEKLLDPDETHRLEIVDPS